MVAAKVSNEKGSEFFVSVEVDKEVRSMGNKTSRRELSIGYCQVPRVGYFVGEEV